MRAVNILRAYINGATLAESKLYHGSPFSGLDKNFENWHTHANQFVNISLTPDFHVAQDYATKKMLGAGTSAQRVPPGAAKRPTVYSVQLVNNPRIFDMRDTKCQAAYAELREAAIADDPDDDDETRASWPKDWRRIIHTRGVPGFGTAAGWMQHLHKNGWDGMWADEGSQGLSLRIFATKFLHIVDERPLNSATASAKLTVYRGEYSGNKGGQFWTEDREFARQFTQSGQDKEILTRTIDSADLYDASHVYAGNPDAVDAAIATAKATGRKAVILNEGGGEPNSIFVFDRTALTRR